MISDHSGYPIPSYATTIWLDGTGNLLLALPSGPDSKAHTITIPLAKCSIEQSEGGSTLGRQMGWQALLAVLKQRQATQSRPVRLGDRAAPVQYDIDAMLGAVQSGAAKPRCFDKRGTQQLAYDDLFTEQS
jgi:hypothetical protein